MDHSIYELPHMLKKEGLDELVISILGLDAPPPKQDDWEEVVHRLLNPKHKIKVLWLENIWTYRILICKRIHCSRGYSKRL